MSTHRVQWRVVSGLTPHRDPHTLEVMGVFSLRTGPRQPDTSMAHKPRPGGSHTIQQDAEPSCRPTCGQPGSVPGRGTKPETHREGTSMAHSPEEPAGRDLIAHDTGIHIHISDGLLHITGDPSDTTITIEADIAPHLAQALLAEWAEDEEYED